MSDSTKVLYTYTPYVSHKSGKKYDVYVPNPQTGKLNIVSFGDSNYEDYTIHKDSKRKEAYLNRHKNDYLNDPLHPGFWSANLLWNKQTLSDSWYDTLKRYNLTPTAIS
jgi:hypothetical protein